MASRRRLTLLRHGHADEHPEDFGRTLSVAGRAAAARAGEQLARSGWQPDYVLASAAPRALATAELAAEAAGFEGRIVVERELYLASEAQCLAALRAVPPAAASVLLVAHNPGLTRLGYELSGRHRELAPADFVSVELELDDWSLL